MTSNEKKIVDDLLPRHCETCERNFIAEILVCPTDATVLSLIEESLIGKVFADRYEIDSIIGEGGMGKVYKAKHRLMKRMIAIKVVHTHLVSSSSTLTRFQQEAEAASSLNHPNIVTVHDFGLAPRAYLVMDYLDGVSLGALLENNGHLAVNRSLPIFIQICSGLAHAHKYGVVHRDLKPTNIMLVNMDGQTDYVKIVDFGIAKLMLREVSANSKNLTATGETFGSPLYMSPEQCRAKNIDARSDIYSLGCVMYRTLTGHQPVVGQDLLECYYNHVNVAPRRFKDICPEMEIPEALEAIVIRCMEKDPKKRFQSMLELKDSLELLYQQIINMDVNLAPLMVSAEAGQLDLSAAAHPNFKKVSETEFVAITGEEGLAATVAEAGRAATAAEAGRAATAAEAGRAATAAEVGRAATAAEAERAAAAAESERAATAAESARATSAAEAGRATAAKEAARSASAAEAGRVASVTEAGLAASAVESGRAATFAEAKRAAAATNPGNKASADELNISAANAEYARAASAAESARAATAAEFTRVASAIEAGLAASATEAAFVASAHEAALVASAVEAGLVASAVEAGLVASAAEAGFAASALEAGLAASAAEAGRAASVAEAGRVASATAAQEHRQTSHVDNKDSLIGKSED